VNEDVVINVSMQAMQLAFKIAMPLLLVGLAIGLVVSIFQAVTQIQLLAYVYRVAGRSAA
jgi:flagellar biosynthesis protein FliQ